MEDELRNLSGSSRRSASLAIPHWEKLKYHPFWGSPLSYQAPPRQFQPPKCKLTPSKIQIVEGRFLCISIQTLQIGGCQSLFGGCQFTFWRVPIYILEAEIVLGVLYRKGVIPKKVGTLGSCDRITQVPPRFRPFPECALDTGIATFPCHTTRSVKLPSFRHFQDRFLTTLSFGF